MLRVNGCTHFGTGIGGWDCDVRPGRAEGEGFGESDGGAAAQCDEAVGVGALGDAQGVLRHVDGCVHGRVGVNTDRETVEVGGDRVLVSAGGQDERS